jgi:hypothetical protein
MRALTTKMETVTVTGRGRTALCVYQVYEIDSQIFSYLTFSFCGVILDWDKYIFSWQACFIWEIILWVALHSGKYSMFTCSLVHTVCSPAARDMRRAHPRPGTCGMLTRGSGHAPCWPGTCNVLSPGPGHAACWPAAQGMRHVHPQPGTYSMFARSPVHVVCSPTVRYIQYVHLQSGTYSTLWYIYLLTAIGLTPGDSSTVQYSTVQYTVTHKQYKHLTKCGCVIEYVI